VSSSAEVVNVFRLNLLVVAYAAKLLGEFKTLHRVGDHYGPVNIDTAKILLDAASRYTIMLLLCVWVRTVRGGKHTYRTHSLSQKNYIYIYIYIYV
jgi:hypothetical protein